MRVTRSFFAVVLLCMSAGTALAGRINILDPNNYPATVITDSPFIIGGPGNAGFISCATRGELPAGTTADGCFAGVNGTSDAWSGLELVVPNIGPIVGQSFDCNTDSPSDEIFKSASCTYDAASNSFDLKFTNGTLRVDQLFIITEDGVVPPEDFPATTAYVTFASTPEPPAGLLLLTGVMAAGAFGWAKKRAPLEG